MNRNRTSRAGSPGGTVRSLPSGFTLIEPYQIINPSAPATGVFTASPPASNPCGWYWNHCGSNGEIFSFHPGGANVAMVDGSVHLLSDQINGLILRYLVSASEGIPVEGGTFLQ